MCQTVVCHDSRAGVPDLYDKELAVLAHEVVSTGATLVTIMDACHSRSAMREGLPPGLTPRFAPGLETAPELRDLLPELVDDAAESSGPVPGAQLPGHVALSACDEWEVANERHFPDGWHGVFTEALGHALGRLGHDATYRQVFSYARCRVGSSCGRFPAWKRSVILPTGRFSAGCCGRALPGSPCGTCGVSGRWTRGPCTVWL